MGTLAPTNFFQNVFNGMVFLGAKHKVGPKKWLKNIFYFFWREMLLKREERNFQKKFVVQISTRQGQNV